MNETDQKELFEINEMTHTGYTPDCIEAAEKLGVLA